MKLNYRSLLTAVITASLALPGAAMADKRGHGDRDYDHDYGRHHSYKYDRHHDKHGYRGNHGRYYGHSRRGHDDGDLLIGLLVGGVLGYALNNSQHNSTVYDSYPRARAQRNSYTTTESYSYSDSSCLQEREYTTTVRVGGRNVEAYGTACLQPDGSWKRGPAETASY